LDSWLSDLEVEGARAPVPHSWRRHWLLSVLGCVASLRLLDNYTRFMRLLKIHYFRLTEAAARTEMFCF